MGEDQLMRLIYLGMIGIAVGGWVLAQARGRMSQTLQQAAVWGLIFLGFIGGYGLWEDIRRDTSGRQAYVGDGQIEVRRQTDGHFYLTVLVQGVPVDFVVDTGATDVALTLEDARRIGLDVENLRFSGQADTANGTVPVAPVRLDRMELEGVVERNIPASVTRADLFQSLLGMSYLSRFERIEIARDTLILTQ